MVCFAFTSSNLGTLAMEQMGPIAGTASSVQGVVGTIGGAAVGYAIGQAYDGTALPFLLGHCGLRGYHLRARRADGAEAPVRGSLGLRRACEAVPEDLG